MKSTYNHSPSGFTIVELLIVVVISAILIGLAVPSFQSFIGKNRLATISDEIYTAISFTRMEAVMRRTNVTLCAKNSDGATTTCEPLGVNADYANGWLIFLDDDTDGVLDVAEELLKVTDAFQGNMSITNSNTIIPGIRFGISGRVAQGAGTLTISANSTTFKTLDVSRSGSSYFN